MSSLPNKPLPLLAHRALHSSRSDSTVQDGDVPSSPDDKAFGSAEGLNTYEKHKYRGFLGLAVTTIFSILLLVADVRQAAFSGHFYTTVTQYRASISIAVQIISAAFGVLQVSILCRLFNYASRIYLARRPVPLRVLPFWSSINLASIRWSLSLTHLIPLLLFIFTCAIPAALWAGAISPVSTITTASITLDVPQYSKLSNVKEWPSEVNSSGPRLRNEKGLFTYSPGVQYAELLTQALSTATTLDGSARQHVKYDNSNFVYVGRSFGAGASVGLADSMVQGDSLATSYRYQEDGYTTATSCIYNSSAGFHLEPDRLMLYAATGFLPDSVAAEYSVYVGHGMDAIMSIGVAREQASNSTGPKYLGIAAGTSYADLNTTQCETRFKPTLFDVTVDTVNKTIAVAPTDQPADDIEPTGRLTHALQRQFELYSNDLTNIYESILGNAINFSISDYATFLQSPSYHGPPKSAEEINLAGLTNAITAMTDDLLVTYASAQLMIAHETLAVPAELSVRAVRFGQTVYVIAVFVINCIIILVVVEEAIRLRSWKFLGEFDYSDLSSLAIASSRGGLRLAYMVPEKPSESRKMVQLRSSKHGCVLESV